MKIKSGVFFTAISCFVITGFTHAESQQLPCYRFHKEDVTGHDIAQVSGDLRTIAEACSKMVGCVAFTPAGWLKSRLNPIYRDGAPGWYEKTCLPSGPDKCRKKYEQCRATFECEEDEFESDDEYPCNTCYKYLNKASCSKFQEEPKGKKSQEQAKGKKDSKKAKYNEDGLDQTGFDREGFDKDGFNSIGRNRQGFNKAGFDEKGFDKDGFDRNGFDANGFNENGFDRNGFDENGFDKNGFDRQGRKQQEFKEKLNELLEKEMSRGTKFYKHVDLLLKKSKLTSGQAKFYLIEIGSWFELSDKDPKQLFRKLALIVHPDKCKLPSKIDALLKGRGFPSKTAAQHCEEIFPIVAGLYSKL